MPDPGIANILHRDTIAMIVGSRTFERGEQCFAGGNVLGVEAGNGELCGVVRPREASRAPYEVRIWVRPEGLAYECTCPIGANREFCKHTVAIALAHLDKERRRAERELEGLRDQLMKISISKLFDGLVAHARTDPNVLAALRQICAAAAPTSS